MCVCVLHLTPLCCTDNPDFKDDPELYAVVKDNGLVGFEVWQVCVLGLILLKLFIFNCVITNVKEAIPASFVCLSVFFFGCIYFVSIRVCLFFSAQCVLTMADDYR